MANPVLIIQTSARGFEVVQGKLQKAGLVEGKDFILFTGPFDTDAHIKVDEKQLLITGSFGGDDVDAAEFVRRAKQKKPFLKAGYMSGFKFPGEPYDFVVDKFAREDTSPKSVVRVVCEFLSEE